MKQGEEPNPILVHVLTGVTKFTKMELFRLYSTFSHLGRLIVWVPGHSRLTKPSSTKVESGIVRILHFIINRGNTFCSLY